MMEFGMPSIAAVLMELLVRKVLRGRVADSIAGM
jgi:hypothetical protein